MSKQDRQKLSILIVLLGVLGLTIVLGYRMARPPTAATIQPSETAKTSSNPPAPSEAHIRLDLLENPESGQDDIGKRNPFQYGQAPLPAALGPPRGNAPITLTAPPPPSGSGQLLPPGPPQKPLPPPIPLKFQGYAVTNTPDPELVAFIADESRHYNVTTGEVLMGRFRIVSITTTSVEVEDLEHSRRQTLPLLK